MRVNIGYPYAGLTPLWRRGNDEVWMGASDDCKVQTSDFREQVCDNLLVLEPPCVHPHAYEADYRAKFERVFAFGGPNPGNVTFYRHRLPPLWPELPTRPIMRAWEDRKDVVAVCSNKHQGRYQELLRLSRMCDSLKMELWVYGRIPFPEPWYRGPIDQKILTMSEFKYAYCWENESLPLYCTEKLPEALAAGCIPLYFGADLRLYSWGNIVPVPEYGARSFSWLENPGDSQRAHARLTQNLVEQWDFIREDMSFTHVAKMIHDTLRG